MPEKHDAAPDETPQEPEDRKEPEEREESEGPEESEELEGPAEEPPGGPGVVARRRTLLITVVAAAVVLSAGGIGAATLVKSPAERAASEGPPPADVLTAPVEYRVLKDSVVLRGTVRADQTVEITALSAGGGDAVRAVVTRTPLREGADVDAGSLLIEISGRPLFALQGTLPAYRDLKPGAHGADVTQLQQALAHLGHTTTPDAKGTFGTGTKRALSAFYASRGYDPLPATADGGAALAAAERTVTQAERAWQDAPKGKAKSRAAEDLATAKAERAALEAVDGPMLPAAEVVFLRSLPARADRLGTRVGAEAGPGTELLTVSSGELVVQGALGPEQRALVRAGQQVEILSEVTGTTADGTVTTVSEQPDRNAGDSQNSGDGGSGEGSGGGYVVLVDPVRKLPVKLAGEDVRLTVTAGSSKEKVLIVPVSAISAGADGKAVVTVYGPDGRHRRTEVTTGTTGNGFVAVRPVGRAPLRAGDRVIVGVTGGTPDGDTGDGTSGRTESGTVGENAG
ncbi:peptidoglycan-binding protein [Streptomyces brasiliscabiei]|uniref:Peptidoglycan-binding protein n=1 Tax=Streptomyces brasiliscabiei TaxID=2736302 RepID=A0ABU8G3J3_9ACTN